MQVNGCGNNAHSSLKTDPGPSKPNTDWTPVVDIIDCVTNALQEQVLQQYCVPLMAKGAVMLDERLCNLNEVC